MWHFQQHSFPAPKWQLVRVLSSRRSKAAQTSAPMMNFRISLNFLKVAAEKMGLEDCLFGSLAGGLC